MFGNGFGNHLATIPIPCSNCGSYDEVHEYLIKKNGDNGYPGITEAYIHKCMGEAFHYDNGNTYINLCDSCKKYFDEVARDDYHENTSDKSVGVACSAGGPIKPIKIEDVLAPQVEDSCGDSAKDLIKDYPREIISTCQRCRTNDQKAMILCRELDIDFFGVRHIDLCDKCYKEVKRDIKESKEVLFFKRLPNCKTSQLSAALNKASYTHHFFGSDYDPEIFILDENEELPVTCLHNPMNIKVVMKERHGDHSKHAVYLIPYKEEE